MTSPPTVAVYNRFWHSQGGGERHSGMIAQVLSEDGADVALVGHQEIDLAALSDHLGLDLSGCRTLVIPDHGYEALAEISADFHLFINGSYMNRLAPRSPRSGYLCYFPTPFDHDMEPWRKWLVRRLGNYVRASHSDLDFGIGWYPPEGGRRTQWTWTSGDGVMVLPTGPRRLRMSLGAPGSPGPRELVILAEDGETLATIAVTQKFQQVRVDLGARDSGSQVRFRSTTFTPAGNDVRDLGVAVSRPRLEGGTHGPRERLAGRFPWLLRDPRDLGFLDSYTTVMANSAYTRGWIATLWHRDAEILFPPIQVSRLHPQPVRESTIVTVGRFFAPGLGHAKRQLEMVEFFGDIVRGGGLPGWTLHVVGGCEHSQEPYLAKVRAAAAGLPVVIHPNAPRTEVERLMSTASVFWSATGYGEDEAAKPWAMEHFGMTTVEAMAGGAVPIVIDKAGQKEIVRDGVDGYRWSTPAELSSATLAVATDDHLRARLAHSAIERAQGFSEVAFATQLRAIVAKHALLD